MVLFQVNNAATNITKKITDYTAEDISAIMGTNFESVYHLCQVAHPLLKDSGNGSIVFISSVAGLKALPVFSVYAASKGMFRSFSTFSVTVMWIKLDASEILYLNINNFTQEPWINSPKTWHWNGQRIIFVQMLLPLDLLRLNFWSVSWYNLLFIYVYQGVAVGISRLIFKLQNLFSLFSLNLINLTKLDIIIWPGMLPYILVSKIKIWFPFSILWRNNIIIAIK